MEETEEDPFFFKHDSLLPYRQEVCSFFGGDWRCGLVGMSVGWVVAVWGGGVLGLFSMRAQGVLEE